MTREAHEKAKSIIACIDSAKKNIESFERICEAGKGEIVICTKERLDGGHHNVTPIYISGSNLETIKEAYIGIWETFAEDHEKELSDL